MLIQERKANTYQIREPNSTRDLLSLRAFEHKRIQSARGYGKEQLLNECDGSVKCSEKQHILNRRTEFIIVN